MVTITLFGWEHRISQDGLVESSPQGKNKWGIRTPEEVGLEATHAFIIRQHLKDLSADFPATMKPKVVNVEPEQETALAGADVR